MRRLSFLVCVFLLVGCISAHGGSESTFGEKALKASADCTDVDDAKLAADVSSKIAKTTSLKDFAITATANGAVVTLTGKVKTGANKGTATRVARSVKCVKSVENKLEVEDHGPVIKTKRDTGSANKSSRGKKSANQ